MTDRPEDDDAPDRNTERRDDPAKDEPADGDAGDADVESDEAVDNEASDPDTSTSESDETAEGDEDTADDSSSESTDAEEGDSSEEIEESDSDDVTAPEAKTDGEGYPQDRKRDPVDEPEYPDPDEGIGGISTPPGDKEMPLGDHIEEMILRLAVVLLIGAAATAIGLLWASEVIEFIWLNVFPGEAAEIPPPHVYHPLELWMTRIKVAALAGILVALPMFVYQCYLFMRPGLYPHERKYYLSAVPLSVVLAGLGMLFSYFLVLPILFRYFTFYSEGSAEIAYALGDTFNLIITLTGILAIVFQIPLFIMLAIMMGVTTRRWLAQKRLYFWAAFFAISFMFTVDPTMMAPIVVALIMIALFEGTLALLKWTGKE